MKATVNPTTQAQKRYVFEFTLSIIAYIIVLFASVYWLNHGVTGPLKIVVAVVPVFPIIGIFIAGLRWYNGTDEYNRHVASTSMALAGCVTALCAVTYGFLENAGLPKMSVWLIYVLFMTVWGIATPFVRRSMR
jgi:hypothetical protein